MLRIIVILFLGNALINAQNVRDNTHQEKFQGRVKSIKTLHFDDENDLINEFLTLYNENGDLVKKITYDNDRNPFWIYEYQYDEKRKLITHTDYSATSKTKNFYEYVYDDKENLISQIQKGCNNKNNYFYDNENRLIKKESYIMGDFYSSIKITYTKQGKEETHYTKSNKKFIKLIYDKNNNLLEQIYYFDNQKEVFKYDAFENEVQLLVFDNNDTEIKKYQSIYYFDSQNNWIKRKIYRDNELSSIIERDITYWR